MKTVGRSATISQSPLSKQLATSDDAAANEEEVEEQIEERNVEKTARENETGGPMPMMSNEERAIDDDAVSASEEVQQQVEENAWRRKRLRIESAWPQPKSGLSADAPMINETGVV